MKSDYNSADLTVLIVEDTPGDRDLVIEHLGEIDVAHRVLCAETLQEAITALEAQPVDVIVLDLGLPDSQGPETLRRLLEKAGDVPIIVATALDDERSATAAIRAGAQDYVIKGRTGGVLLAKALSNAVARTRLSTQIFRERQQAEIQHEDSVMEHLSTSGAPTSVASRMHGEMPLRETSPERFDDVVSQYAKSLDLAVDRRVHQVDHDVSAMVRNVALEMGSVRAGPRDVIDLHKTVIANACAGQPAAKSRLIVEEGRFLLVELMGGLMSIYRNDSGTNPARNMPSARGPDRTAKKKA